MNTLLRRAMLHYNVLVVRPVNGLDAAVYQIELLVDVLINEVLDNLLQPKECESRGTD